VLTASQIKDHKHSFIRWLLVGLVNGNIERVYNIAIEQMNVSEPSQTAKTRVKVVRTSSVTD